ncbi:MAG: hypothetical protein AB1330_01840 [Bacillota bacterium]
MTRKNIHVRIIKELESLPELIRDKEAEIVGLQSLVSEAREKLKEKEGLLLMDRVEGVKIDGKNAEIRQAQVNEHTVIERRTLKEAEEKLAFARIELSYLHNRFSAARSIVDLLRPEA